MVHHRQVSDIPGVWCTIIRCVVCYRQVSGIPGVWCTIVRCLVSHAGVWSTLAICVVYHRQMPGSPGVWASGNTVASFYHEKSRRDALFSRCLLVSSPSIAHRQTWALPGDQRFIKRYFLHDVEHITLRRSKGMYRRWYRYTVKWVMKRGRRPSICSHWG